MDGVRSWGLLFRVALLSVGLVTQQGCAQERAGQPGTPLAWDSPRMVEIKREWQSLVDAYERTPEKIPGETGKDKVGALGEMTARLFRKRLSDQDLRQLAASSSMLSGEGANRRFEDEMVLFMVRFFTELGDRDSLVKLLSARCPSRMGPNYTLEFYLASQGTRLKDPILVLGEAYSKSIVPQARHDLAAAVHRGFVGLGIRGKDDAEYVANAMQWYQQEKDHLIVNSEFYRNDRAFSVETYETDPELFDKPPAGFTWERLFREKTASQEAVRGDRSAQPEGKSSGGDEHRTGPAHVDGLTPEKELARLEGVWEVTSMVSNGKPLPQDRTQGARFVFRKGTLTMTSPDAKEEDKALVRLDPQRDPKQIDLLSRPKSGPSQEKTSSLIDELQERTALGIYELREDSLRICLSPSDCLRRPSSFKSEEHSGDDLITLKRPGVFDRGALVSNALVGLGVVGLLAGLYAIYRYRARVKMPFREDFVDDTQTPTIPKDK